MASFVSVDWPGKTWFPDGGMLCSSRIPRVASVKGRIGGGQELAEAVASGCLSIGKEDRVHHKLIAIHPAFARTWPRCPGNCGLCAVVTNRQLKVLACQDEKLAAQHFRDERPRGM